MSGNNAISKLIFDDLSNFKLNFPNYKIIENYYNESLIFILSGGVGKEISVPQLPTILLEYINKIDKFISKYLCSVFPLSRCIVIKKL